nr:MAG TPA: hypothetical protein [Caudoviricetes sp.]
MNRSIIKYKLGGKKSLNNGILQNVFGLKQ